jgi:hypothetical protein
MLYYFHSFNIFAYFCVISRLSFCAENNPDHFSFTSKYPDLNIFLQRIQEMLFTDICKHRTSPIVCADHVQLLYSSMSHEYDKIPIDCCKVDKDLEKPDDLE